ncbi:MAG TPA: hypothetical protein ENO29_03435 [Candidatus Aminicenantes bacterium]|nr:MAG: hypothetical protein C0168_04430 [Candidatus Aminicenantes bacterium]HEK85393.1 hypothetical protein [Candidatus Aminicenantes bacterium]
MAQKHSPLDYAFAVGRIRALENYLISYEVFKEAAEAPDLNKAVEVISEAGEFGERFLAIRTSDELENFLQEEKIALDHLLEELFLEKSFYFYYQQAEDTEKISSLTAGANNPFILNYFRLRIDLFNLKFFLRCHYLELPVKRFEQQFIPGGTLEKRLFIENYNGQLEDFGQVIRFTSYFDLWQKGFDFFASEESFIVFEREIENLLMEHLKKAKQIIFGPEPLFAYGLARKRELKLMQMVLTGKMLRVPPQILKERISQTYV